ncbi:MAG: ligase-associated DNA damage response endonuclease PdeM [Pseudomonadota bacterium]
MNFHAFDFCGIGLRAYGAGALFWPHEETLVVSDLHLGKSERIARRSGQLLPPYETRETLSQLEHLITHLAPSRVICLGDNFDDLQAEKELPEQDRQTLNGLVAQRDWVWIEGNHDPGPMSLAGVHLAEFIQEPLTFRHIAEPEPHGEISGHYHPKTSLSLRGRHVSRPCFLVSQQRLIMPAFGTYTGALRCNDPAFAPLIDESTYAIVTGPTPCAVPVHGLRSSRESLGLR